MEENVLGKIADRIDSMLADNEEYEAENTEEMKLRVKFFKDKDKNSGLWQCVDFLIRTFDGNIRVKTDGIVERTETFKSKEDAVRYIKSMIELERFARDKKLA